MTGARGSDRIELRGLRALGRHGALAGERESSQPFEIDLDLRADLSVASGSDRLTDTVDYGAVVAAAVAVVETESWHLIERLAERVAEAVGEVDERVGRVTATVRKLRPPVAADLATAGVRVTRPSGGHGPRRRAFLGLGSNLGNRAALLRDAVAGVPDVVAVSPVYETEPVGGPEGQAPYLNLVAELWTGRSPRGLLGVAHRLEASAARERAERWGPRTLDVDVLWVAGEEVDEGDLVVPHPRMGERRFVLAPLADLAPDLVQPGALAAAAGEVRRLGPLTSLA